MHHHRVRGHLAWSKTCTMGQGPMVAIDWLLVEHAPQDKERIALLNIHQRVRGQATLAVVDWWLLKHAPQRWGTVALELNIHLRVRGQGHVPWLISFYFDMHHSIRGHLPWS